MQGYMVKERAQGNRDEKDARNGPIMSEAYQTENKKGKTLEA